MDKGLTIFHGSQQIVEVPRFGVGKPYNDYGQGFYCTESIELAKEWARPVKNNGFANRYLLRTEGLNIMQLTQGEFHILHWLALLLANRHFDINSPIGANARDFILSHFLPSVARVDVIVGYRADDSYFSFAEDFVNNTISLRDLNVAMRLGSLGQQVVLISEKSFDCIEFQGFETADYHEYFYKRGARDKAARLDYATRKKNLDQVLGDVFILDIMRENMQNDDSRLRSILSE